MKLEATIKQDIENGLIPFFCGSSIGSTWAGSVDPNEEIAKICKKYGMWFNIDAAYLGTSWFCEELRGNQKGV